MNVRDVLPRDAIPSIDEPSFGREYFGDPGDEVVVVDGDPPRAYPVRILSYHEVVNDATGGRPIAVTWCPICWSAAVYERVLDGRTLTLGVSGKLADDALVMYDRETGSEWKQPSGECIAGELSGTTLAVVPAPTTTWGRFRGDHPAGVVLQPEHGTDAASAREAYDMDRYRQYAKGGEFGLYGMRGEGDRRTWGRDDLDAKTLVLGVERGDRAVGYPRPAVEAAGGVVTDEVGDLAVVVVLADGRLGAFESPGLEFAAGDGELLADGAAWDPVTGESDDGRRLERVPARTMFAFAWQDVHGPEAFYG